MQLCAAHADDNPAVGVGRFMRVHNTKLSKPVFLESKYAINEEESKSSGKIHLTALIEVTVSNFTYNFST